MDHLKRGFIFIIFFFVKKLGCGIFLSLSLRESGKYLGEEKEKAALGGSFVVCFFFFFW